MVWRVVAGERGGQQSRAELRTAEEKCQQRLGPLRDGVLKRTPSPWA